MSKSIELGDSHNFGKKVLQVSETQIYKPRNYFLEAFFLSDNATLKKFMSRTLHSNSDPSSLVPTINYEKQPNGYFIEKIQLEKVETISASEAFSIGEILSFCIYFGICDLHSENLFFGYTKNGTLMFFPIDIEVIGEDIEYLSQTLLVTAKWSIPV